MLFLAPWILAHFWPASTLLRGPLALATLSIPEIDPQIWECWDYADEDYLDKIIPYDGFLISNVSVTYDDFREFYTSDRIPYVWTLP